MAAVKTLESRPTSAPATQAPKFEFTKRGPVRIKLFATGLHNPSHMEWTQDGRLLVSEHTAGQIKDVTKGGDMKNEKPFVYGLEGPAGILPLPDGRILVSETWGGRVKDIGKGGDMTKQEAFADEMSMPYSLVRTTKADGSERITVSESLGAFHAQITEVTNGGTRTNFTAYVKNMPSIPGAPGLTPIGSWPSDWERYAAAKCVKNWQGTGRHGEHFVAVGPVGQVLKIPHGGGDYLELVDEGYLVAWGLQRMGGMYTHPVNGRIYAVQPEDGSVVSFEPDQPQNQGFEPPVIQGLNMPTCPRFSSDGETMYVCSSGDGVIWEVTDFLR